MGLINYIAKGGLIAWLSTTMQAAQAPDVLMLADYVRSNGLKIYDAAKRVELRTLAFNSGVIVDLSIGEDKQVLVLHRLNKGEETQYLGDGLDDVIGKVDYVSRTI